MVERKYLAHFLDAKFDMTYKASEYARLGKDLEEYSEELNPEVEVTRNIIGEQSVKHSGYEVSGDVDPFYFENYDNAYIKEHLFYLSEIKDNNKYLLDDNSEGELNFDRSDLKSLKYRFI